MELVEKHEDILERRAELLRQMENRREQLDIQRRRQEEKCAAARQRNATMLQDLQRIEDRLREKQLQHPQMLALETQYWVSVEESLPIWENFLLNKGPHPTDRSGQIQRTVKQNLSAVKQQGRPPRPKPRADR